MTGTEYYEYYSQTYKVERPNAAATLGYLLDLNTGEFRENLELLGAIEQSRYASSVFALDEEEFILRTETIRNARLSGDGPIFAWYKVINAISDAVAGAGHGWSTTEREYVIALKLRTFALWEAEFARRACGEPPSFTVRQKSPARLTGQSRG